jgi:hypothetical protein
MRTLRIEINRGQGWQLRAEGKIPANVTAEQITQELQGYAIQYPRRALINGVVVAQAEGDVTRNPLEDLIWRAQGHEADTARKGREPMSQPGDGPIC